MDCLPAMPRLPRQPQVERAAAAAGRRDAGGPRQVPARRAIAFRGDCREGQAGEAGMKRPRTSTLVGAAIFVLLALYLIVTAPAELPDGPGSGKMVPAEA